MFLTTCQSHVPVLRDEVVNILSLDGNKTIVDATFGGGGYSMALLNNGAAKVIAFDRDADAIERAKPIAEEFGNRFKIYHSCFSEMDKFIEKNSVDAIVFDFGISSFQVDDSNRGFSFRLDGPLDMRMDKNIKITAADVVNTFSESDICDIIFLYGEEKKARSIAKAIVARRSQKPFSSTLELAEVLSKVVRRNDSLHSATLTFQALRIFVNDELSEINKALNVSNSILVNGGKIVTVAFHSLEDRIVKNHCAKDFFIDGNSYFFKKINKKVIIPSLEEIRKNPRSRSARLRGYIKHARQT